MPNADNKMATQKITVSIPTEVLDMMNKSVPARQRSLFIVEAIKQQLEINDFQSALEETAGAWSDANHPEMNTPEDIDRWIAELRGTWTLTGAS
jgi:metal-responsive CopG/Arc/MetJ family transcriptional regulator